MEGFEEIDILRVDDNFIRAIGSEWMLITAGNREQCNTMTASWGMVGEMWGRHAVMAVIRPQRYTIGFVEWEPRLSLSFFDAAFHKALAYCGSHSGRNEPKIANAGLSTVYTDDGVPAIREARLILQCRKMYVGRMQPENFLDRDVIDRWYEAGDFHKIYIAEIEHAYRRR